MWISPKVNRELIEHFEEMLSQHLGEHEHIEALLRASATRPFVEAVVLTSMRLIGIVRTDSKKPHRALRKVVDRADIRDVEFSRKAFTLHLADGTKVQYLDVHDMDDVRRLLAPLAAPAGDAPEEPPAATQQDPERSAADPVSNAPEAELDRGGDRSQSGQPAAGPWISPKIKAKLAASFQEMLARHLPEDERVEALIHANGLVPSVDAVAVTSRRVIGIWRNDTRKTETDKLLRKGVDRAQIRQVEIQNRFTGNALMLHLADGTTVTYPGGQDDKEQVLRVLPPTGDASEGRTAARPQDPDHSAADIAVSDGPDAAVAPGDDRQPAVSQISIGHEQRSARWAQVVEERARLEAARGKRIEAAKQRAATARQGRKLASLGGYSASMVLYEGAIECNGERHELTRDVRATVSQTGNTSSSQGWAMKTQHDNREVHVVVEGPDFYAEARAAKGQTSASDLSTAAANFTFRQEAKKAREFAAAVNNAAIASDTYRAAARDVIASAARDATAAYEDTAAIETIAADQRRVGSAQRNIAAADLAALEALEKPGMLRRGGIAHRLLVGKLQKEIGQYRAPQFDRGQRPSIPVPESHQRTDMTREDAPSPGEAAAPATSVLDQIKQLGDLHAAGVLTDDEFATKKTELLSRL